MYKLASKYSYLTLLFLLIFFHAVNNFIWIKGNPVTLSWNSLYHLNDQISRFYDLANSNISCSFNYLMRVFNVSSGWPRLVYFITFVIEKVFGRSDIVTRMSNFLYFSILIFSTYLIGKRCLSKFSGVLAAVFISFYPGIFALSRSYGLDLPLTAMVPLNIYFLLRAERFSDFKYSLIFGLSVGLGILVKGEIALFLAGPFLYILTTTFMKKEIRPRFLLNIFISFSCASIVSSIWWWGNSGILMEQFLRPLLRISSPIISSDLANFFLHSNISSTPFPFAFKWFFFYPYDTFCLISPLFSVIFAIGLYYFIKLRDVRYKNLFIAWIVFPYVILTIVYFKEARHYFPSFPAFALISAFGVSSIRNSKKISMVFLVVMAAIIQFFVISYSPSTLEPVINKFFKPSLMEKGEVFSLYPPEKNNYKAIAGEISGYMKRDVNSDKVFYAGIIEDAGEYFLMDKKALKIEYLLHLHFPNIKICRPFSPNTMLFGDYYKYFRYLIIITKETPPFSYLAARVSRGGEYDKTITFLERAVFIDMKNKFDSYEIVFKKTLYPDGDNIYLMKNNSL